MKYWPRYCQDTARKSFKNPHFSFINESGIWTFRINKEYSWTLKSTHEHLSALISKVPRHYEWYWRHGVKLMNAHQLSWVLLAPWCHAHECSWILMSTHECSWAAMSIHEHGALITNVMCTNKCLLALEHSYSPKHTHKQLWALMSMVPWPKHTLMSANTHLWLLRHGALTLIIPRYFQNNLSVFTGA